LAVLQQISDELAAMDGLQNRMVGRARAAGASWRLIAQATGYSEMGARGRWRVEGG
jgi:hypothetical protein